MLPSLPPEARRARIRSLTASLADLVRSLHDRSLSHRDLKASNILINFDSIDGRDQLSLIDLVGVRSAASAALEAARSEPGASVHQSERGPGADPDRPPPIPPLYLPWGLSPLNDWKGFWRSIEKAIRSQAIPEPAARAATFLTRRESSSDGWRERHRPIRRHRGRSLVSWRFSCSSSASCATFSDRGQPLVPTRHQLRTGPFIIFSNFPMTDDPPAVRCLQALERDMKQHLDFRPRARR